MKRIILILLSLGLIGGAVGLYMYFKPVADLGNVKSDVKISATELLTAFETDEAAATGQYLGKILEVSGKVMNIETEDHGGVTLVFEAGGLMGGVICRMDKRYAEKTAKIQAGVNATIRGECTGMAMDVELARCAIIE